MQRFRIFPVIIGTASLVVGLAPRTALPLSDPITATQCSTADAEGGAVDFAFRNDSQKTVTTVGFLIADAGVTRASFSRPG